MILDFDFYRNQYHRLLTHNEELEKEIVNLSKRIGGRKPADKLKYLGMHRLSIKRAVRLFRTFGICWFYTSNKTNKILDRKIIEITK